MSQLGMDLIVPFLVKERLPLTRENWLTYASPESTDDPSQELLDEMPEEIASLPEGQALPLETYMAAVSELPKGVPAPGTLPVVRPSETKTDEMEEPETEENFGSRAASLRRLKVVRGYGALLDQTKGS